MFSGSLIYFLLKYVIFSPFSSFLENDTSKNYPDTTVGNFTFHRTKRIRVCRHLHPQDLEQWVLQWGTVGHSREGLLVEYKTTAAARMEYAIWSGRRIFAT